MDTETPGENERLAERMKKATGRRLLILRSKLIERNIPLVIVIAKRYKNCGVDFLDLVQEGCAGLCKAADMYVPGTVSNGVIVKFTTYATFWIMQQIREALAEKPAIIRAPRHATDLAFRYVRHHQGTLVDPHMDVPDAKALSKRMGITEAEAQFVIAVIRTRQTVSINAAADKDNDFQGLLGKMPESSSLDDMISDEATDRLYDLIDQLDDRSKLVIALRYGLAEMAPLTLTDIAEMLGITKERVRQIELKIILKLRDMDAAGL